MSKGDFLLKDGFVTIKYLPRVKYDDLFFGVDYAEKARFLGKYFRQQYSKLKDDLEQPRYFREQLICNYLYKGPVLEWYLRVKIRLEKDYQVFHDLLPKKGQILDLGCGYGFMSYILQFAAPGRVVTGFDYDEEKITVANHCFSRNENILFLKADISEIQFGPAEAIILSDVLHYLKPEQQEILMQKCMDSLSVNGILLIREGNSELKNRHIRTRLTEIFSTRILGFNKTAGHPLHFISGETIRDMAFRQGLDCRAFNQSDYTSNQLFVITHPVNSYEKV
jgi:2-polyprenyl-3-methyl-5-hydroxy-6-metoxy-1,4-benzoquinol methylase